MNNEFNNEFNNNFNNDFNNEFNDMSLEKPKFDIDEPNNNSNKLKNLVFFVGGTAIGFMLGFGYTNYGDLIFNQTPETYTFKNLKDDYVNISEYEAEPLLGDYKYDYEYFYYLKTVNEEYHIYYNEAFESNDKIIISKLNMNMEEVFSVIIEEKGDILSLRDCYQLSNGNMLVSIESYKDTDGIYSHYFYTIDENGSIIDRKEVYDIAVTPEIKYDIETNTYLYGSSNLNDGEYISKYDSKSNEIFRYKFELNKDMVEYLVMDKDDSIIVTTKYGEMHDITNVIKLDEEGKEIYNTEIDKEQLHITSVIATSDNGVLIVGNEYMTAKNNSCPNSKAIKIDSKGNVEWIYDITGETSTTNTIVKETSKGYLIFSDICYYSTDNSRFNQVPTSIVLNKDGKEIDKKQFAIMSEDNTNEFSLSRGYTIGNNIIVEGSMGDYSYTQIPNVKFAIDNEGDLSKI